MHHSNTKYSKEIEKTLTPFNVDISLKTFVLSILAMQLAFQLLCIVIHSYMTKPLSDLNITLLNVIL